MHNETGRSLIEMIGVLAIMGVLTVSSYGVYNTIIKRQNRMLAVATLENVAKSAKDLLNAYGDYNNISIDYLIKAGALKTHDFPLVTDWSITPNFDGTAFSINLDGLSKANCIYFTTTKFDWTNTILANGTEINIKNTCTADKPNYLSFIIER